MDRHIGDPYVSPDYRPYRNPRGPPPSSDNHQRRSPNNYHRAAAAGGGFSSVPRDNRSFDSPRYPPPAAGFRPPAAPHAAGGFNSEYQVPLTGQKRGFPFSGRGGSPDHSDGGSFAKLFVGSVPRTCTEEDIRPLFEEHGRVVEVALIKDKRTGLQQGPFEGLRWSSCKLKLCLSYIYHVYCGLLGPGCKLFFCARHVDQEEDMIKSTKI